MAINPTSVPADTRASFETDLNRYQGDLTTAQDEAKKLVDWLNTKYVDKDGNKITHNTLEEWKKALDPANGDTMFRNGWKFGAGHTEYYQFTDKVNSALKKLETAQDLVAGTRDTLETMDGVDELLKSGDIQGAILLLGEKRASNLDKQLTLQVAQMQARNLQVTNLTNQLTAAQNKDPKDEKEINRINNQLQSINGDSQLQMIKIQDLVNKRNQAFDMMSTLLKKFADSMSGIISKM